MGYEKKKSEINQIKRILFPLFKKTSIQKKEGKFARIYLSIILEEEFNIFYYYLN